MHHHAGDEHAEHRDRTDPAELPDRLRARNLEGQKGQHGGENGERTGRSDLQDRAAQRGKDVVRVMQPAPRVVDQMHAVGETEGQDQQRQVVEQNGHLESAEGDRPIGRSDREQRNDRDHDGIGQPAEQQHAAEEADRQSETEQNRLFADQRVDHQTAGDGQAAERGRQRGRRGRLQERPRYSLRLRLEAGTGRQPGGLAEVRQRQHGRDPRDAGERCDAVRQRRDVVQDLRPTEITLDDQQNGAR